MTEKQSTEMDITARQEQKNALENGCLTIGQEMVYREEKTDGEMKIRTITDEVVQYVFENDWFNPELEICITAVFDGNRALLIDAGYSKQAEELKAYFDKLGVTVEMILLSHYHPDHTEGAHVFKAPRLIASRQYHANYIMCSQNWDTAGTYAIPNDIFDEGDEFSFGVHQIRIVGSGGHCRCSVMLHIDETFIHLGDLLMKDIAGDITFPCISRDGSIGGYLSSFKHLESHTDAIALLAHGSPIHLREAKVLLAENAAYFERLTHCTDSRFSEEVRAAYISKGWSFSKWHDINLKFTRKPILKDETDEI